MAQPPRNYNGFLGRSMVGAEQGKKLRVQRIFRISDALCNVGAMSADNICYIQLPVGPYTYRMLQFSLLATAAIASKTIAVDGENVVQTAAWNDYVEWVSLEINGREVVKYRTLELVALNAYHRVNTSDGNLSLCFGSPNQFKEDLHEDAYLFGTGNIFSAKLCIKTRSTMPAGMKPRITAEYAPIRRPVGYFQSTTVNEYTFAGAGKQTITDIPNGIDFASIWLNGTGIKGVLLEIDKQIAFEASAQAIRANASMWGKDVVSLPGLMLDGFRDGDAIGFDSLTNSDGERKRGADVRLTIDLAAATSVRVITMHCGLFGDQR